MRFVTDMVGSSSGFSVEFTMTQSPCGKNLYTFNDTITSFAITSPMNGDTYMPNLNCAWKFKAIDDKVIQIKFEKFELEGTENDENSKCSLDYLEIHDDEVRIKQTIQCICR